MSTWNYRVIAHESPNVETYLEIVEVYHDENGIPNGHTAKGVSIGGDSIESLSWTLDKMKLALDKPILSVENFPQEYKPKENG